MSRSGDRGMSEGEMASGIRNRGISPRGENFVTQDRAYIEGLIDQSPAGKYDNVLRFENRPGTRDALIDSGGTSRSDRVDPGPELNGLPRIERGNPDQVHIKGEGDHINFGLRRGLGGHLQHAHPGHTLTAGEPCRALEQRLRAWRPFDKGLSEWLRAQSDLEPCIAEGLRRAQETEDWLGLELYSIAALEHPSRSYTATLCDVLDQRRDDMDSEILVDALDRIVDPAATECLRHALTWVPDWDEYGQLARKAVYALERIGTPEAIAAIREEVTGNLPFKVTDAATEALARATRQA